MKSKFTVALLGQLNGMKEEFEKHEARKEDAASAETARLAGPSGMEAMEEAEWASAEHGRGEPDEFESTETETGSRGEGATDA